MGYKVNKEKCIGCGSCVSVCPFGAIKIGTDGKAEIDKSKCNNCGKCREICPVGAIEEEETIEEKNDNQNN